ncbi:amidohydrolase [Pseudoalteromonas sp. NBT06-2]|uniref:carbon-nitrogen hydrolase family protein n=1 Tax=Pseudoalteromonas sp. NBT06-2 TaxID=2025950 RepID=UPI000BA74424|nr:amidohydrolase [Pseudoalteromonas sp. NBT06-2]
MLKLSAIQMCSAPNVKENLKSIELQLTSLVNLNRQDKHLVVLPECCLFFGGKETQQLKLAQQDNSKEYLTQSLAGLAKKYQLTLVAGTIPLLAKCGHKFFNSSYVFSPKGEILGSYDKIHLFDVAVDDNEKSYLESRYTQAGKSISVIKTSEVNIGLSVCFDIRFPSLYQALRMKSADIITVPSAFTRVTGRVHWQALLQARAIENQVYIIAPAQEGIHENGRETWGHSMIISPWGEVLCCLAQGEGIITADFKQLELDNIRKNMPTLTQNRFEISLKL